MLAISTELGDKICHYYKMEKAVCPPELKGGLFTTAAVDNIDHSSTSAHDLFHGTGISNTQTTTSVELPGLLPTPIVMLLVPRRYQSLSLRPTPMYLLLLFQGKTHRCQSKKVQTEQTLSSYLKPCGRNIGRFHIIH